MPGFTNRKPQHRGAQGFYPLARLHFESGQPFTAAGLIYAELLKTQQQIEAQRLTSHQDSERSAMLFGQDAHLFEEF